MPGAPMGAVLHQMARLFGGGTVAGLDESQLLERFIRHRDEAAFAALVSRFGPMVLSVCRKLTHDPHAADDAFQATFLVLVRRARSIRDRELLGNWLYGVAVKVSRKANVQTAKRRLRERDADMDQTPSSAPDALIPAEHGVLLHEELAKLPEKYRAPLVLCFLEGQTHEQAATTLGWRLGTLKARIARAKTLLQTRLGRRGVTISAAAIAAGLSESARAAVPPVLLHQTVQAALALAVSGTLAAGMSSATAYLLSREVVAGMTLSKIKLIAIVGVAFGVVATSAGVLARQGQEPRPKNDGGAVNEQEEVSRKIVIPPERFYELTEQKGKSSANPGDSIPQNPGLDPRFFNEPKEVNLEPIGVLLAKRVEMAKQRLDAQTAFYENGKITIDRFCEAARRYIEVQIEADGEDSRVKHLEEYVRLLRFIRDRELAKDKVGNGTPTDIAETSLEVANAEVLLSQARGKSAAPNRDGKTKAANAERESDNPDRDRKITEALNMTLDMPFDKETPLEDVVKYIREKTAQTFPPNGMPIYVDPLGFRADQFGTTHKLEVVRFNQTDLKLKTSIRLMLNQLGLSYYVKDGLLIVSSPLLGSFPESEMTSSEKTMRIQMGGGMGGGMR